MEKESNKIRFLTTVSDEEMRQETYGITPMSSKSKFVDIEYSEIGKQLEENIFPLIEGISEKTDEKSAKIGLSKVTIKIGATLEGKLFIASGKVESSIEIEFCKK